MTRLLLLAQLSAFALLGIGMSFVLVPSQNVLVLCLGLIGIPMLLFLVLPTVNVSVEKTRALSRSFTWWHWLLLLVVLSSLTFRLRDVRDIDATPVDDWALVRILLECVVALVLVMRLVNRRTPWLRSALRGPVGLLSLFVLVSGVSALWSVRPDWTLYKSLEYGADLALAAALLVSFTSALEYKALFNWIWGLIGLAVVVVWMGALVAPGTAFTYGQAGLFSIPQLSGVWPMQASNSVGDLGGLLSVVALGRLFLSPRRKQLQRFYWGALLLGLATMFMAQCRSAIAGFLVGAVLLLFLTRRTSLAIIAGGATGFTMLFTGIGPALWDYLLRNQPENRLLDLSGRLDWWTSAWQKILQRPLVGWGGFAGGRFIVLAEAGRSISADIHSTPIETLLDTGFIGLLFLLLALTGAWWILWRAARNGALEAADRCQAIECLAVLGLLSVRSFFSTTLVAHSYPAIVFILIVGYSEYLRRRMKRIAWQATTHPVRE